MPRGAQRRRHLDDARSHPRIAAMQTVATRSSRARSPRLLSMLPALLMAAAATTPAVAVRSAHAAPAHRTVEVVTIDGAPVSGPFAGVSAAGVRIEGRDAPIALDGIRELRFPPAATRPSPSPSRADGVGLRVFLRGGEILVGRLISGSENGLEFEPAGLPAVKIAFDGMRRVESDQADPKLGGEPGRVLAPRAGMDVAYARSGDAFPGTLVGADKNGVTIDQRGDKRTVKWADLVVLHVDEAPLPAVEGLETEIETVGGSRLSTTDWSSDGATFSVRTRSGLAIEVPASAVSVVRATGGRFVYASDLPWTFTYTYYRDDNPEDAAFHEAMWGPRADRNPLGPPLRIGGVTFRHGISAHAKSVVTVPLGKRFTRLETKFGIDDGEVAGESLKGDVTARIVADGREVWTSGGSVKEGEAARTVGPIDVSGVETLVLEVDFGAGMDVRDAADWADPILVKAK
jgi:hypothetical protein